MSINLKKQSGHAAILFVLLAPMLFGMFTLASDGARAVQNKARVNDAIEVAGLVLAANNTSVTEQEREILAGKYIQQYLSGSDTIAENGITVTRTINEPQSGCSGNDCNRYIEYKLNVKTKHVPWFGGSDSIASFDDPYNVTGQSEVRKYQSEAIDVMLVADYSGSMNESWQGAPKIDSLIHVINQVTAELKKYNDLIENQGESSLDTKLSTIGLVPYSLYTHQYNDFYQAYVRDNDVYKRDFYYFSPIDSGNNTKYRLLPHPGGDCPTSYRHSSYDHCKEYTEADLANLDETIRINNRRYHLQYINDFNYARQYINNSPNDTIDNMWIEKKDEFIGSYYRGSYFYDIPLNNDFDNFNSLVSSFHASGQTASYEGIIRGAQLLSKGKSLRRLLVVLSDGIDSHTNYTKNLVDRGMCSKILDGLGVDENIDENIKARMVLIGFDYDMNSTSNQSLLRCFGDGNVFKANDSNEILNTILELISEEIGRLK